jgi:hypothetical protein
MMLEQSNTRARFVLFIFGFVFFTLRFSPGFAQPVSSAHLIDNAQRYDGHSVIYSGEVIGDVMIRGEHAWVNVHDGQQAIGIWLPKKLAETILYTGNYKAKGDWVEIAGIFHRVCEDHVGELDIHATSLKKIHSGYFVSRIFNRRRMNKAVILLAVLGCVWILRHLIKT